MPKFLNLFLLFYSPKPESIVVECLGPEPGSGHGFRFQGASEYYRIHTYNLIFNSYSLGNKIAIPNFYFLILII